MFLSRVFFAVLALMAPSWPSYPGDATPMPPFKIIGDVYYIGTAELGAYLVTSDTGHIVIDGGTAASTPLLLASIERLGFKPRDVKWLLTTQAHFDHVGSLAGLKAATGAKVAVMRGDDDVLRRGGLRDYGLGDSSPFEAVEPDRVLADGDTIAVGARVLTAHLTAGHTRGCTTWTLETAEEGRRYAVVMAGSLTVLDRVRLVKDPSYPGIADDFRRSVATLRALRADVFLGAHAGMFDLAGKRARQERGERPNPFIDPAGLRAYADTGAAALEARLAKER